MDVKGLIEDANYLLEAQKMRLLRGLEDLEDIEKAAITPIDEKAIRSFLKEVLNIKDEDLTTQDMGKITNWLDGLK